MEYNIIFYSRILRKYIYEKKKRKEWLTIVFPGVIKIFLYERKKNCFIRDMKRRVSSFRELQKLSERDDNFKSIFMYNLKLGIIFPFYIRDMEMNL